MFKNGDKVVVKDLKKYCGDYQDVIGVGTVSGCKEIFAFIKFPYVKHLKIVRIDNLELAKKACNKCGQKKLYSEFYKGHGKCKECCKKVREAKKVQLPYIDLNTIYTGNGMDYSKLTKQDKLFVILLFLIVIATILSAGGYIL